MSDFLFPKTPGAAVAIVDTAVAVLDDEGEELNRLSVELAAFPGAEVYQATTYKDFRNLIQQQEFDAVSVDWELYGIEKGPEILEFLLSKHPDIARVVYTKHERRRDKAMSLGADVCLIKQPDDDLQEYRDVISQAVRLGLARRIVRCLIELGETGVPSLPSGQLLNQHDETLIYETALRVAVRLRLERKENKQMYELLLRRGWWRKETFDASSYARLAWHHKIAHLAGYAALTRNDLARIFDVEPDVIEGLVGEGDREFVDRSLMEAADHLLSVLGYLLKLSGYDPEIMPHLWRMKDFYEGSSAKPPWNELGFSDYLSIHGVQGINESLVWIRSH